MYICSYALKATKCSIHKWTQYISSQRHLSCKNATRLTDCWYIPMACLQVLWFNFTQSSVCQVVCDPVILSAAAMGSVWDKHAVLACEIMLHSAYNNIEKRLIITNIDCTVQWLQWLAIDPRGAGLIATFQWRWNVYVMPVHVKKPQMLKISGTLHYSVSHNHIKAPAVIITSLSRVWEKVSLWKRLEIGRENTESFFFLVLQRSQTCILVAFNQN